MGSLGYIPRTSSRRAVLGGYARYVVVPLSVIRSLRTWLLLRPSLGRLCRSISARGAPTLFAGLAVAGLPSRVVIVGNAWIVAIVFELAFDDKTLYMGLGPSWAPSCLSVPLLGPLASLAPLGCPWLLLAPPGSFWLPLAPPGSSWLCLAPPRPLLASPGSACDSLSATPGSSLIPLAPSGSPVLLLPPPGSFWHPLAPEAQECHRGQEGPTNRHRKARERLWKTPEGPGKAPESTGRPQRGPGKPQSSPGRPQRGLPLPPPKHAQEPPARAQEPPKRPRKGPREAQEGPREAQEGPRKAPGCSLPQRSHGGSLQVLKSMVFA